MKYCKTKLFTLNFHNKKSDIRIILVETDQERDRKRCRTSAKSANESVHFNNLRREISGKKTSQTSQPKNAVKTIVNGKNIVLNELEIIKILNRFVLILHFIYIVNLNMLCLYILPFYFKKSLSVND